MGRDLLLEAALRECVAARGDLHAREHYEAEGVHEADYFGLASGRDVDKFMATGLTPVKSDLVDAPYVGEFPLVAECKLYRTIELGLHTQFVGEIVDVKADESVIEGDSANIELVKPFVYNTHRRVYYAIGDAVGPAFEMGKAIKG